MEIAVICDEQLKQELLETTENQPDNVRWFREIQEVNKCDVLIDLLFEESGDPERSGALQKINASLIIVNSVASSVPETASSFVKINGWRSFLKNKIIEAATGNADLKAPASEALAVFGKSVQWLKDEPGFVTARVVAMIINEAYHALEENVSTKEEIDIAMKTGTNYPYGPFEWAKIIGLKNIAALLEKLPAAETTATLLAEAGN